MQSEFNVLTIYSHNYVPTRKRIEREMDRQTVRTTLGAWFKLAHGIPKH